METKFIEGTNEQYSIREDGVVISNYRIKYSGVTNRHYIDNSLHEMIPNENHAVNILQKQKNVRKLLFKYFNYVFCKQCNCKSDSYLQKGICKKCVFKNKNARSRVYAIKNPELHKEKRKRYRQNNPEAYKAMSKRATQKAMLNLSRHYVASSLNIHVNDLTEELYELHRSFILFKRQVSKELNINIERLV